MGNMTTCDYGGDRLCRRGRSAAMVIPVVVITDEENQWKIDQVPGILAQS
jgi:hypothetical protein